MAWPGTAAEVTKLFKIYGIPQNATGFVAGRIISLYGPGGNVYEFSALVSQLNSQLALVSATQYAEIQALIVEWDAITDYSELIVDSDNKSSGQLVDHAKRRDLIRATLSNILGFYVPKGGFFTDASAMNASRLIR